LDYFSNFIDKDVYFIFMCPVQFVFTIDYCFIIIIIIITIIYIICNTENGFIYFNKMLACLVRSTLFSMCVNKSYNQAIIIRHTRHRRISSPLTSPKLVISSAHSNSVHGSLRIDSHYEPLG